MNTKVTGCRDCPFYNDGQRYEFAHYCNHPDSIQDVGYFKSEPEIKCERIDNETVPITPEWCPLKKESITIEL